MSASAPAVGSRVARVWRRNFLVWRKLAVPSLVGNMVDPLIYLFALGLGIGALVGEVDGGSYLAFIAPGIVCINVLNTASFEGLYSAFTRMHVQKTWEAMLNTPMTIDDIVLGEWVWAANKAMLSSACILVVLVVFGVTGPLHAIAVLPALALLALMSSAIALAYNAVSPSYDFFMYFFTLYMTPLMMLSGVFFPIDVLPGWLQSVVMALPMAAAVDVVRDVLDGDWPDRAVLAALLSFLYMGVALGAAILLTRRRLR